jgi:hypothetical protein
MPVRGTLLSRDRAAGGGGTSMVPAVRMLRKERDTIHDEAGPPR